VAPVTEQGVTSRSVYLPAGADWYNFWTNERVHGGQTITVPAPIETLPLFVRAGSIVPLGAPVENTKQRQAIASVRVYPGADATFSLYQDDGTTYAYEKGGQQVTRLVWHESSRTFTHEGAAAWSGADDKVVTIVGQR
jgi:alpha-D-xyloside xylohydrolase